MFKCPKQTTESYILYLPIQMMELVVERSDEEQDMQRQLTTLKEELAKISIQDEFARYAKTERKINRLTEEIKKYSESQHKI